MDKSSKLENQNINKPKWMQVFSVNALDFHSKQSDFVINTCNRAGNIIMVKKQVMPVIEAFMSQLKKTESTRYMLAHLSIFILNIWSCGDGKYIAGLFNLT